MPRAAGEAPRLILVKHSRWLWTPLKLSRTWSERPPSSVLKLTRGVWSNYRPCLVRRLIGKCIRLILTKWIKSDLTIEITIVTLRFVHDSPLMPIHWAAPERWQTWSFRTMPTGRCTTRLAKVPDQLSFWWATEVRSREEMTTRFRWESTFRQVLKAIRMFSLSLITIPQDSNSRNRRSSGSRCHRKQAIWIQLSRLRKRRLGPKLMLRIQTGRMTWTITSNKVIAARALSGLARDLW